MILFLVEASGVHIGCCLTLLLLLFRFVFFSSVAADFALRLGPDIGRSG